MLKNTEIKLLLENDYHFITAGCNSNIYRSNNIILKKYTNYTNEKYKITPLIFEELQKINYDCFIKLYKLFLDEKNTVVGYTCNYIEETKEYFTKDDLNLLLYNLNNMQKDFLYDISSRNILMDDPNTSNILISKDKVVIIDPDCYRFGTGNIEKNIEFNKETLLQYIYYKCILATIRKPDRAFENIDRMLDIDINPKTDLCRELKKIIK